MPGGEIIFVHPQDWGEIWISNVDGTNARQCFDQTFEQVHSLSVQKGGKYVLAVAEEPWGQRGYLSFSPTQTPEPLARI